MKKYFAGIAAAVGLSVALAGCGNKPAASASAPVASGPVASGSVPVASAPATSTPATSAAKPSGSRKLPDACCP